MKSFHGSKPKKNEMEKEQRDKRIVEKRKKRINSLVIFFPVLFR